MRILFVLTFVALACASAPSWVRLRPMTEKIDKYVFDLMEKDGEVEMVIDREDGTVDIAPQFILSWQARRFIRKLQKQMPCGWEKYGIPPLAPFRLNEAEFKFEKGIYASLNKVFRFKIDGLDNFQMKKFKLNIITNKINFDFIFKNIDISAQKYDTATILDALHQLGLSVQYEGNGTLDFGLVNLRIAGVLKYKLPILWGSAKIKSLKTTMSLEKCNSNIKGLAGDGSINRMINRQIENTVENGINENQSAISDLIEDTIVPKVNKMLKGNDFWSLIDIIFSNSDGENENDPIIVNCVPPPDPWV